MAMPKRYGASGLRTWSVGVAAGVLAGVLVRALVPQQLQANHPKGPAHDHIGSMNSLEPDNFCVWLEKEGDQVMSSMDFGTAYGRISGTLMVNEPGLDWNGLNGSLDGYKLTFSATGPTPCDENPNRSKIEIEYWVRDDTSATVCGGYSCAFPFGQLDDDPVSGHPEWSGYAVRFKTAHLNHADPGPGQDKPWWRVVNHETGHMLGLSDPPPCSGEGISEDSVMHPNHYYGCAENKQWPTINDWNSVLLLAGSQQTTGGGNFNKF
jgi:hypothetical protein